MNTQQGTKIIFLALISWLGLAAPVHLRAQPQEPPPAEPTVSKEDNSEPAVQAEADENTNTNSSDSSRRKASREGLSRGPVVMFGQNVEIKKGESAEAVVVIGGSATIHGKVNEAVVAIGGDIDVDGEVGDAAVAVMGSVHVRSGASVNGDVVSVGGRLEAEEGAKIRGQTEEVAIGGMRMPHAQWIQKWLTSCVFMLRPLSPNVGWVWGVAFVYFLLFLFVAAVFRTPVQACVTELTNRPATTFLMGLLTKMLLPLVIIILLILVVGIVVVPFLVAAIFVLGLVGKVAVLEAIGFSVGRMTGKKEIEAPLVALIVGSVILALLYMIPVIGLLTMLLLSVWSLGCALTAAFRGFRREVPESKPAYVPAPAYTPAMAAAPASVFPGSGTTGIYQAQTANAAASGSSEFQATGTMGTSAGATTAAATPMPGDPPVMPEVLIYPKATFWERIGAAFLDFVLVMILGHVVGSITFTMIIGLAYVTALWTLKGTTIGGIVLGLKVVRMDGRPVTFAVSLVRGLAAGFSAVVLFLGFLWILWDPDRQGWHDKIAGTVVLRLPRGTPLVCV